MGLAFFWGVLSLGIGWVGGGRGGGVGMWERGMFDKIVPSLYRSSFKAILNVVGLL